jgi:TM2 domain-containing membrane protein YozV
MDNLCHQCGAPLEAGATKCQYCGAAVQSANTQAQAQPQVQYVPVQPQRNPAISNTWPIKNKMVAALLAILFGGLGIQHFYLGNNGKGIISIIFCWTYIPSILGLVEGIIILASNDENFQLKYKCRLQ